MKAHKSTIILGFVLASLHIAGQNSIRITDESNTPIEYASILNRRSQQFTFSNESGYFDLGLRIGDTLEIRHVSFRVISFKKGRND